MTKRPTFPDRMIAVHRESFDRRVELMLDRRNKMVSSRDEIMRRLYWAQARVWGAKANADHAAMISWASR